jgi:hypothetical protein
MPKLTKAEVAAAVKEGPSAWRQPCGGCGTLIDAPSWEPWYVYWQKTKKLSVRCAACGWAGELEYGA